MLPLVEDPGVDLIGQHEEVAIAQQIPQPAHVLAREHAAGRIVRAVQDDEARPIGQQARQLIDVQREAELFADRDRHRAGVDEVDGRAVDREARVGVDDLVPLVHAGEQREEDDRLGPGGDDDVLRVDGNPPESRRVPRDGLADLGQAGRRAVVRVAGAKGLDGGVGNVPWCIEVRFADLEVDDRPALTLDLTRAGEDLESGLGAQAAHSFRVHAPS